MKHGFVFLFALALGAVGCGGEQHQAHGPGGEHCQCDHKAGEHCEHCKQPGHECKCDHKAGEHCEHCKGKHPHGPGGDPHAHGPGGDPHAHGPGGDPHAHGEDGGHHEDETKGPLGDLHAVLAPVWHDKSPERLTKACDQAKTMRDKSAAVEAAPAPQGADAAAYAAAAKEMTAACDALVTACAASGRPDVEAKFSAFHDAFHKTVEKVSGKPHKH